MKKLIFIIVVWIYFIFEALTEAMNWEVRADPHIKYHLFRLLENFGILLAFLVIPNLRSYWKVFILSITSGLSIYEMTFSWYIYGDPLYNKTSTWIIIPHPFGWFWLALFCISLFVIILLYKKEI